MEIQHPFRVDIECDVSFFVPCYNEEKNIVSTLKNIIEATNQTGVSYEILVTDDKSQDDTVCVVENFICESPGIPITLIKNKKIWVWGEIMLEVLTSAKENITCWLMAMRLNQ